MKAITRDDVVAFHKAYFQPGRAIITVVGDVTPIKAKASVEKGSGCMDQGRRYAVVRLSKAARTPAGQDLSGR